MNALLIIIIYWNQVIQSKADLLLMPFNSYLMLFLMMTLIYWIQKNTYEN